MSDFMNALLNIIEPAVKPDCVDSLRGQIAQLLTGYTIEPAERALSVYAYQLPEAYAAYMVTRKIEGLSDATLQLYRRILEHFLRDLCKPLDAITVLDVRGYLYRYQADRGVSNRTLDSIRTIIRTFFEWCATEQYIGSNPARNIRTIKYQSKPREALTGMDLAKLRNACQTLRDRALLEYLYSTGCRVSEAVGANRSDIRGDELTVLGKGGKYRTVYLSDAAVFALQQYLGSRDDAEPALFVGERKPHGRLQRNQIESIIKRLGARAGIKLHPHLLRHTMATEAIQHGMAVEEVQQALGHVSINTTLIYAHTSKDAVKAAHKKSIA